MTGLSPDALAAHVAECDECRAADPPLGELARRLAAEPAFDGARLSALALARLAPELAARSPLAFRRRVARVLGVSLLPLPVVLAADALLLAAIYRAAAALLPSGLAAYLVASYAVAFAVAIGLAYAAIPLLLARRPVPPLDPPPSGGYAEQPAPG